MNTENTLTEKQINDWKKEYGKVFKTIIGEDVIIWRKLRRNEYVSVMLDDANDKDTDVKEKVFLRQNQITKIATLYPNNIEELIDESGALATCMSDQIMLKSGFEIISTVEM